MMRLIIGSVGSSPLTRGTHLPGLKQKDKDRFIPAYAGNSSSISTELKGAAVHPRLRGELDSQFSAVGKIDGSSPLTRGTHLKWLQHYTNRLTAKLLKNISKQEQSY